MSTEKIRCSVCGELKSSEKFEDSLQIPKTTCLVCYGLNIIALEAEKKKKEKNNHE